MINLIKLLEQIDILFYKFFHKIKGNLFITAFFNILKNFLSIWKNI